MYRGNTFSYIVKFLFVDIFKIYKLRNFLLLNCKIVKIQLKELKERQRQQNKQKAIKLGLDPE